MPTGGTRLRRLHGHLLLGGTTVLSQCGGHSSAGATSDDSASATSASAISASSEEVVAANYARDGFVLVSGLVPPELLERARNEVWRHISGAATVQGEDFCANPDRPSPAKGERGSWPDGGQWNGMVGGAATMALFTPACLRTAAALAAAAADACPSFPVADHAVQAPCDVTLAMTKFPTAAAQQADLPSDWQPHFDSFVREGISGWRTSPKPVLTQLICYLSGSGAVGEGGTVCWPGSHRRMQELYLRDPQRFASLESLRQDFMAEACDGIEPVAVRPRAGDVLFFDLLTGHSTSTNVSAEPRIAVKHSFAVPFQQQAHLLTGVRNIT